jgi:hypothetical protein
MERMPISRCAVIGIGKHDTDLAVQEILLLASYFPTEPLLLLAGRQEASRIANLPDAEVSLSDLSTYMVDDLSDSNPAFPALLKQEKCTISYCISAWIRVLTLTSGLRLERTGMAYHSISKFDINGGGQKLSIYRFFCAR